MKKTKMIVATILVAFLSSSSIHAKSRGGAFEEGTIAISAGYGFGLAGSLWRTYEANSGYSFSTLGPMHGKFEYGVSDKIGLGASVNYRSYDVLWDIDGYREGFQGSALSILARMNIHFGSSSKLDGYWGFGLGYRSANFKFISNDPNATPLTIAGLIPFGFETSIGVRYYFTDNIGIYAEAGFGQALAQGGLVVKF